MIANVFIADHEKPHSEPPNIEEDISGNPKKAYFTREMVANGPITRV